MEKIVNECEKGNLIVLSGPSGAGKDSIIRELKNYYHNFWVSVSMTSRAPRGEEVVCHLHHPPGRREDPAGQADRRRDEQDHRQPAAQGGRRAALIACSNRTKTI